MLWRRVERSKFLTDRRLQRAETQGFIPSIVFTAFCEIKVFLSHFDQRCAYPASNVCLAAATHSAAMRLNSCDRSTADIAGLSSTRESLFFNHVD